MLHSNSQKNHRLENWVYANAAARTAATGFISADVGKVAYQTDNGSYWRLTAVTPTWVQINAQPTIPSRYQASGTIPVGTAVNVDCTSCDTFNERTLAGNTTLTVTGLSDGQAVVVPIKGHSTDTLTWVGVTEWKGTGGTTPSAPADGITDVYTIVKCNAKVFGTVAAGA
jgi:hypothetical protein